jgi:hypothetical protein
VNRDPGEAVAEQLAFADVKTRSKLNAERSRADTQLLRARYRRGRIIERDQEAVPAVAHDPPTEGADVPLDIRIMALEQLSPRPVPDPSKVLGR